MTILFRTPTATGAADAIIAGLLAWSVSKHKNQHEEVQKYRKGKNLPPDESSDADIDWAIQLEYQLQRFKQEISKHFRVSTKVLELVECEQEKWKVKAIFKDNFSVKYLAEVSEEGYTKLSKLR